jgi:hypothetical protein
MQKGHTLEFSCQKCQHPITFSIFKLSESKHLLTCDSCRKNYSLNDEVLMRQLNKFVDLCRQIHESEEILSSTSVGINVGDQHVAVPYKLLLTRLNSSLDLMMGDTPCKITFRIEPAQDLSK